VNPIISILIPTFNSSQTLKCAIESVLLQDFQDFDIWVTGDACTDDSEMVVKAFGDPRIHWHNMPTNSGRPAIPNNYALEQAKGKYIAHLCHDDLWFPWHLSTLLARVEQTQAHMVNSVHAVVARDGLAWLDGVMPIGRNPTNHGATPTSWLHVHQLHLWEHAPEPDIGVDAMFWLSRANAGWQFAESKILTALVFPSHFWRLYTSKDHPQIGYLERIKTDPKALHDELIYAAALKHAKTQSESPPISTVLKQAIRKVALRLILSYGWLKPPLKQILTFYLRNSREHYKKRRGLK
jgi:glycosyltransferase involved in cell wall biosynthesis